MSLNDILLYIGYSVFYLTCLLLTGLTFFTDSRGAESFSLSSTDFVKKYTNVKGGTTAVGNILISSLFSVVVVSALFLMADQQMKIQQQEEQEKELLIENS